MSQLQREFHHLRYVIPVGLPVQGHDFAACHEPYPVKDEMSIVKMSGNYACEIIRSRGYGLHDRCSELKQEVA